MNYISKPRGPLSRVAYKTIQTVDRVSAAFSQNPVALSTLLSQRNLWGTLERENVQTPSGPPLLALSFDLDYQTDTDALVALTEVVDEAQVRMSLCVIGKLVEADPEPYRYAVEKGHEIVNHTWSHPDNPVLNPDNEFWHLSVDEMAIEIQQAQESIQRLLGVKPAGFRTPHFKDAPRMMQAVEQMPELRYISTALANRGPLAVPYFPTRHPMAGELQLHYSHPHMAQNYPVLMIPLTPCPEHRWSPFCSYDTIRRPTDRVNGAGLHELDELLPLWRRMLEKAWADRFASVYFDPLDIMRDQETISVFRSMLEWAQQKGWQITTLGAIEQAWRSTLVEDEPIRSAETSR